MGLGLPNDGATQRHGTTMEDVAGVSKRLELEVQFSLPMVRSRGVEGNERTSNSIDENLHYICLASNTVRRILYA